MSQPILIDLCPCGLAPYKVCCELFHLGCKKPATAESLMRSRYSAYALAGDTEQDSFILYLIKTHDPKTVAKGPEEHLAMKEWANAVQFTTLEIVSTFAGQANDKVGKVEFKAYYHFRNQKRSQKQILHEKSRFRRFKGEWVYVDGNITH